MLFADFSSILVNALVGLIVVVQVVVIALLLLGRHVSGSYVRPQHTGVFARFMVGHLVV